MGLTPSSPFSALPPRETLADMFHAAHDKSYGHHDAAAPIEIVNLRVTAIGRLPDIGVPQAVARTMPKPRSVRPVWFSGDGAVETAIWWREDFGPGAIITGPAVIEQLDATTPIPPGYRAEVDAALNLVIGAKA